MKKILLCASRISHILNFHLPYIQAFQENGYQVDALQSYMDTLHYQVFVLLKIVILI